MSKFEYDYLEFHEMKPYVYGGKNCVEHIPMWESYAVGDMGKEKSSDTLILDPKLYPPGTKITIETPICPKCGETYENCMVRGYGDECDFDWKQWVEEQYS